MELSYNGTRYNGWQRQNNAPSVQQALEDVISTRLRETVQVTGAGRTDTGVHAAYYVAHFDALSDEPSDGAQFADRLNAMLSRDVAVRSVVRVADNAHARFNALEREYEYHILPCKDPFRTETAWYFRGELDVVAMNAAAGTLLQASEFTTFSKLHSANKTDICDVRHAEFERLADGEVVFTIRADRFLRNMVRSIVGTLVDVGRGKITPDRFAEILASRDRSLACSSAPAQGLFLSDVHYPEEVFTSRNK